MPSPTTEQVKEESGIRRYRMTVRARLALTYSALLTGSGVLMLGLIYLIMRYVPTYDFAASPTVPSNSSEPVPPLTPPGALESATPATAVTPATELLINTPEQLFNVLLWSSAAVLVLLALAGIAVGWIVAGRMLKPLQHINSAVHRAAMGDLGHRIALVGPKDEISELAANFDDMLAQLERSFAASTRFAQNASHELRTPLATTRAMLDVALAAPESPQQQKVLERLRIMNERSIETVSALLDLASIASSPGEPQSVDLAGLADQALAACSAEAAERGIAVSADLDQAATQGDPVLLRQLLLNLLHNAIRHNHANSNNSGGFLAVATRTAADGGAVLEVTNSGPVLDGGTLAQLSEPFRRGAGRTAGSGGHGLGLSIVAAITERHHGILELAARRDGGLCATITFPATGT